MPIVARLTPVQKARQKRRVARVPVEVNAETIEGLNQAMEKAVRVDLFRGVSRFRDDVLKIELDKAFNAKSYDALMDTAPFKDADKYFDKAAERLVGMAPQTRDAVREGIKGGFTGDAAGDASFFEPLNFDKMVAGTDVKSPPGAPKLAPTNAALRQTDAKNPKAIEQAQARTQKYLKDLFMPQRQAVQALLGEKGVSGSSIQGIKDILRPANDPMQKLNTLSNLVGLNDIQAQSLLNFEAAQRKNGMTGKKLEKAVSRQSDMLLTQRAKTIAVTEARASSATAQVQAWLAMQEQGLIPDNARKRWQRGWEEICPKICEPVDGVEVGLNEFWTLGNGKKCFAAGMAHINCKCLMTLVFDDEDTTDEERGRDSGVDYTAEENAEMKEGD